jgi:hypothetical protein
MKGKHRIKTITSIMIINMIKKPSIFYRMIINFCHKKLLHRREMISTRLLTRIIDYQVYYRII